MTPRRSLVLACVFVWLFGLNKTAIADWPVSPYQFVRVGGSASYVAFPGSLNLTCPIAPDGSGGLIAVWPQGTSNVEDLVGQRLDAVAAPKWGAGSSVSNAPGPQLYPAIVADGSGGAFASWADWRDTTGPDIYVQHIAADGSMQWAPSGLSVCTADQPQRLFVAAPDGQGGVLIAWEDSRDQLHGSSQDVYAQRLDLAGNALWGPNGRAIATGPTSQSEPKLLPTGAGGAYVAWSAGDGVWMQMVAGDGTPAWSGPVHVVDGSTGTLVSLLPDHRGGAFVGMSSSRLQRVSSAGAVLLGSQGASPVMGASFEAGLEDGSGGTYWLLRTPDRNYHVTHVDSAGVQSWPTPVVVGTGFVRYWEATLISDGVGGTIATWIDTRSGGPQVYATRLDASGHELWGEHGLAVHVGTARKNLVGGVTDGANGLIVAWDDHDAMEVRAQRVDAAGSILPFVPEGTGPVTVAQLTPNPSSAAILIGFSLARPGHTRVSVFDVGGRLVRRLFDGDLNAGAHQYSWSGYGNDYQRVARGVYVVLIEALDQRVSRRVVMLGGPTYDPERPR